MIQPQIQNFSSVTARSARSVPLASGCKTLITYVKCTQNFIIMRYSYHAAYFWVTMIPHQMCFCADKKSLISIISFMKSASNNAYIHKYTHTYIHIHTYMYTHTDRQTAYRPDLPIASPHPSQRWPQEIFLELTPSCCVSSQEHWPCN